MYKRKFIGFVAGYFLLAGTAFIQGCDKALDIDAIGYETEDSVIRTEADLFALLNSGYFALAADDYYGGNMQVFNEILADHINGTTLGGNYLAIYSRNVTIFNDDVSNLYAQLNKPIFQANLVLDHIDLAGTNSNSLKGQALFIRALAWFDMVRMYAQPYSAATASSQLGVPLRISSERQKVIRKTVGEVYTKIITDLKEAENLLPPTNGVYATKWAAKALLAKVYFQMNDFANAYLYANDAIVNGPSTLDVDFSKRFSSAGTSEAIFGLIYESNNIQGRFGRLRGNYNTLNSALPTLRLTQGFFTQANANATDKRKAWYKQKDGAFLLSKFDSTSFKLPVLYLTELKLIRAEAAAENGQNLPIAIGDMNDIINRAYGATSSLMLSGTASAAQIKIAARRERELELVGEGNRLQELKRIAAKGESITIRGSTYNCPGLVFPFPNNEVIYSSPDFIQNPTGGCN